MLLEDLPDLEDTQLGKELIQIGEARGEARGLDQAIVIMLELKHDRIPKSLRARIERLSADQAKQLLAELPAWETLQEVKDWLSKRGQ